MCVCVYAHNTIDYFIASRFLCFTHNSLSSFVDSVKCVCFYVLFFANFIIIQYILCVCVWERVCDIIYFDVLFVQIEAGGFFLSSFIRHSMCTIYATYSLLLLSITDDFRCFLSFFSLVFLLLLLVQTFSMSKTKCTLIVFITIAFFLRGECASALVCVSIRARHSEAIMVVMKIITCFLAYKWKMKIIIFNWRRNFPNKNHFVVFPRATKSSPFLVRPKLDQISIHKSIRKTRK